MWTLIFLTLFFASILYLVYMVLEWSFSDWLAERRAKHKDMQLKAGYDYAWALQAEYGKYGGHVKILDILRKDLNDAHDQDRFNDFERGMYTAVKEMEKNLQLHGKLSPVAH